MRRWTGLVISCAALLLQLAQADADFTSAVLSCADGGDSKCKTAASFTAAVSPWNGTTSLLMGSETGELLQDQFNTSYYFSEAVYITAYALSSPVAVFSLTFAGFFSNAYEQYYVGSGAGGVFCAQIGTTHTLAVDTSQTYAAFHIEQASQALAWAVNVTQNASSALLPLSSAAPAAAAQGTVRASALLSPQVPVLNLSAMRLFVDAAAPLSEGFLVPTVFISDQANAIGISTASWQACFQCGLAAGGQCVRVDNGSRSDQFSAFRGTTLASLLSVDGANCSFATGSDASIADAWQPSMQSVLCADTTLQIAVVLGGLAFSLVKAVPSPIIDVVDYGSVVWAPGTNASAIYMGLGNQGSAAAVCQVVSLSCCLAGGWRAVMAAQPSAPQELHKQQSGLHVVQVTCDAPAAEELVGGCELAVVCDSGTALYQYIPFWRAAVPDPVHPLAAQQPWPVDAFAVADLLVSLPANLASGASPSHLRAYNLSLVSQVAVAAGVPVSSVATRRQDARSVLTAASVSFPAGEDGLEAAVRFVHALNASSTSLLHDPPLALHNMSTGLVSIAELGMLGALAACQQGWKQPESVVRWGESIGSVSLVAVSLLLPPCACWVLLQKRVTR